MYTRVEALESDHEEHHLQMFVQIGHTAKELEVKSVVVWGVDSDVASKNGTSPWNQTVLQYRYKG